MYFWIFDGLMYVLLWLLLDWKVCVDVVKLLWGFKKECIIIIVSYDFKYFFCVCFG